MPDDPTSAARSRRYRERQAGRLPPAPRVPCQACEILHTGARGLLCCRCWTRLTPEGRADRADRVRRAQKRKRNGL
jgi:hypothetical protein